MYYISIHCKTRKALLFVNKEGELKKKKLKFKYVLAISQLTRLEALKFIFLFETVAMLICAYK